MTFCELRDALIQSLRTRVRNGEMTERGLARLAGVSQPHIHNVLKGARSVSPDMMDRLLCHLRISAFDLVDRNTLARYLEQDKSDTARYAYLPILEGKIGPGHPWPHRVEAYQRFPVSQSAVAQLHQPVVARLGFDVGMHPVFADNDFVLLDQSHEARHGFDTDALYIVKLGRTGVVRRIRRTNSGVYMATEDTVERPGLWERLPVEGQHVGHFIRAKATLIAAEIEWE